MALAPSQPIRAANAATPAAISQSPCTMQNTKAPAKPASRKQPQAHMVYLAAGRLLSSIRTCSIGPVSI